MQLLIVSSASPVAGERAPSTFPRSPIRYHWAAEAREGRPRLPRLSSLQRRLGQTLRQPVVADEGQPVVAIARTRNLSARLEKTKTKTKSTITPSTFRRCTVPNDAAQPLLDHVEPEAAGLFSH
uniref:Uncharacterized protein n=1 Tax=Mycena chlorophos TaxID=658473 RepID=A0ABQ0LJJ6_MYCCL|nr:predicted protein [Mycena chlorophos]